MAHYRRFFASLVFCGFLFGSVFVVRLQLSRGDRKAAPEFLTNVSRFRTSRVCSQKALVLVNSPPGHSHRRQIIRETWAHPRVTQPLDISVAFGVGRAPDLASQMSLEWEAEIYGDVFQEVEVEGGSSATRVIQLLKSARSACDHIPNFFLKLEDDVFVNPFLLDELVKDLETFSLSNTLWCLDWQRAFDRPHSNATWMVPRSKFTKIVHPNYCVSRIYLMTGRTLDAIIRQHDGQPGSTMLPEDVYVTGMMTKKAGTGLYLLGERVSFDSWNDQDLNVEQIAFAYLAEDIDDVTERLWGIITSEKIALTRTYDLGL